MIDITKFCLNEDDPKGRFKYPAKFGNLYYASDGHIMVRVSEYTGQTAEGVKSMVRLMEGVEFKNYMDIPDYKVPDKKPCMTCRGNGKTEECSECNGSGEVECDYGYYHDCKNCDGWGVTPSDKGNTCSECDGEGMNLTGTPIPILGTHIAHHYLKMIRSLPNPKVGYPKDEKSAIPFKFTGGYGLVMPIRI